MSSLTKLLTVLLLGGGYLVTTSVLLADDPAVPATVERADVDAAKVLAAKKLYDDAETAMRELDAALQRVLQASENLKLAQDAIDMAYAAAVESADHGAEDQKAKQEEFTAAKDRAHVLMGVYAKRISLLRKQRTDAETASKKANAAAENALNVIKEKIFQEKSAATVKQGEAAGLVDREVTPKTSESVLLPTPDPLPNTAPDIAHQEGSDVIPYGHEEHYIPGADLGMAELAGDYIIEPGHDSVMPGQLGADTTPGNAMAPPPPSNRYVRLVPPGLSGAGAAMLHVDVPDGSRVTIDDQITRSRNWSRYRHYRITGLGPDKLRAVRVTVMVIRDLGNCVQEEYTCTKCVNLKAGDDEGLSFRLGDLKKLRTLNGCEPTTRTTVPAVAATATRSRLLEKLAS